ncbi:hypothetical protein CVT25_004666, partial [Psilocybe cyanescens]
MEQAVEEAEAPHMTEEQRKLLIQSFATVKAEFADLIRGPHSAGSTRLRGETPETHDNDNDSDEERRAKSSFRIETRRFLLPPRFWALDVDAVPDSDAGAALDDAYANSDEEDEDEDTLSLSLLPPPPPPLAISIRAIAEGMQISSYNIN